MILLAWPKSVQPIRHDDLILGYIQVAIIFLLPMDHMYIEAATSLMQTE